MFRVEPESHTLEVFIPKALEKCDDAAFNYIRSILADLYKEMGRSIDLNTSTMRSIEEGMVINDQIVIKATSLEKEGWFRLVIWDLDRPIFGKLS